MFVDRRQKISSAEDKQTNLELKQIEFSVSTYLFKSIYQKARRNVAQAPNFLF